MSVFKHAATTLLVCSAAFGGTLAATAPAPADGTSTAAGSASYADRVEAAIIRDTNAQRVAHDRRTVRPGACVDTMSERWARHLTEAGLFEHRNLYVVLDRCHKRYASENLARTPASGGLSPGQVARVVVRAWMHSPEHRVNVLSKSPDSIGVGVRRSADGEDWVVVQNFTG